MKDPKDFTPEDIYDLESQILNLYSKRKMFIGIGWGSLGTGITLLFICMFVNIAKGDVNLIGFLFGLGLTLFVGGIVFFILKSALFNTRINNRKLLVQKAKMYQEIKKKND